MTDERSQQVHALYELAARVLTPRPEPQVEVGHVHGGTVSVYFEAAAVIITLVLLGLVLELRARSRTGSALRALLRLRQYRSARVAYEGGRLVQQLGHGGVPGGLLRRPHEVRRRPPAKRVRAVRDRFMLPRQRERQNRAGPSRGVGLGLSIVASILDGEPQSHVTLFYGNRASGTVMFKEELAALKDTYLTRFNLVHVLSREPQEVELFSGRLDVPRMQRFLDTLVPPADVDEWFLCGPYEMVASLRRSSGFSSEARW